MKQWFCFIYFILFYSLSFSQTIDNPIVHIIDNQGSITIEPDYISDDCCFLWEEEITDAVFSKLSNQKKLTTTINRNTTFLFKATDGIQIKYKEYHRAILCDELEYTIEKQISACPNKVEVCILADGNFDFEVIFIEEDGLIISEEEDHCAVITKNGNYPVRLKVNENCFTDININVSEIGQEENSSILKELIQEGFVAVPVTLTDTPVSLLKSLGTDDRIQEMIQFKDGLGTVDFSSLMISSLNLLSTTCEDYDEFINTYKSANEAMWVHVLTSGGEDSFASHTLLFGYKTNGETNFKRINDEWFDIVSNNKLSDEEDVLGYKYLFAEWSTFAESKWGAHWYSFLEFLEPYDKKGILPKFLVESSPGHPGTWYTAEDSYWVCGLVDGFYCAGYDIYESFEKIRKMYCALARYPKLNTRIEEEYEEEEWFYLTESTISSTLSYIPRFIEAWKADNENCGEYSDDDLIPSLKQIKKILQKISQYIYSPSLFLIEAMQFVEAMYPKVKEAANPLPNANRHKQGKFFSKIMASIIIERGLTNMISGLSKMTLFTQNGGLPDPTIPNNIPDPPKLLDEMWSEDFHKRVEKFDFDETYNLQDDFEHASENWKEFIIRNKGSLDSWKILDRSNRFNVDLLRVFWFVQLRDAKKSIKSVIPNISDHLSVIHYITRTDDFNLLKALNQRLTYGALANPLTEDLLSLKRIIDDAIPTLPKHRGPVYFGGEFPIRHYRDFDIELTVDLEIGGELDFLGYLIGSKSQSAASSMAVNSTSTRPKVIITFNQLDNAYDIDQLSYHGSNYPENLSQQQVLLDPKNHIYRITEEPDRIGDYIYLTVEQIPR